ncbi:hypothetical protein [Herbaspirillum huttiense]|uniref:Uncharacterized protein n=1 Tax=Herbaspirillum huttiense subsp. lycopersici TaxID=3074428 RepID=A0ABU2EU90_9BURK|nr:hypothetical protein [Herbaspirillum huttiense]MDR9851728.1 hypothetical protein [Herbaspirillum huttiense SE1]
MKIVQDCWDQIDTYNCQYGAHIFDGTTAKIYVNNWLSPSKELFDLFYRKNDEGFAGHCVLVFEGVKVFDFSVTIVDTDKMGNDVLQKPISCHYDGPVTRGVSKYVLEGSLHGFRSSVAITIEAQRFTLHILGENEPAEQS